MKILVFTFLFIVFFISGYSQNKNISVSYSTTSFDDFITDIESKTNYKFYYDSSETSGILITIKLDNA